MPRRRERMGEQKETREIREWKGEELPELVADLKEIESQIDDLEERKAGIRGLIEPYVREAGDKVTIACNGRLLSWHPPSTTTKLDRGRLVAAGVTPEQLEKGTVKGTKKGYFDVRVDEGE